MGVGVGGQGSGSNCTEGGRRLPGWEPRPRQLPTRRTARQEPRQGLRVELGPGRSGVAARAHRLALARVRGSAQKARPQSSAEAPSEAASSSAGRALARLSPPMPRLHSAIRPAWSRVRGARGGAVRSGRAGRSAQGAAAAAGAGSRSVRAPVRRGAGWLRACAAAGRARRAAAARRRGSPPARAAAPDAAGRAERAGVRERRGEDAWRLGLWGGGFGRGALRSVGRGVCSARTCSERKAASGKSRCSRPLSAAQPTSAAERNEPA